MDRELAQQAIAAMAAIETNRFDAALSRLAGGSKDPLLQVAAIEAASRRKGRLDDAAFKMLVELTTDGSTDARAWAVQILAGTSLTKQQLTELAPVLSKAGPTEIQALVPAFQRSADQDVTSAFLDAMGAKPFALECSPLFVLRRHQTLSRAGPRTGKLDPGSAQEARAGPPEPAR